MSFEYLTSETFEEYPESENESEESFEEISSEEEKPKNKLSLRETILEEFKREREYLEDWGREEEDDENYEKSLCEAVEYLNKEIFPFLLHGIVKMLEQAEKWNALEVQKCRFNGLDNLAEYLWNKNPRHPDRQFSWRGIYEIRPFRKWLRANPRPIYPKSWLWSQEEAALIIQRNVRGWIARKRTDVQELRQFWKVFNAERAERSSSLSSIDLDEFDDFRQKHEEIDICQVLR